jgi:hypothetical protein
MKKILLFISVAFVFAACNTAGNSPKATVDAMLTAMKSGNLDDVKKFITKEDIATMESLEQLGSNILSADAIKKAKEKMGSEFKDKAANAKYTLKDEKINGDNATVTAEVEENGKTDTHTFDLKKEDGAWKISLFGANSGFGGDMGKMKDQMKNMNMDSLMGKMKEEMKNVNMDSLMDKAKEGMDKMKGPAGDSLLNKIKEQMKKMKESH